MCNGVCVVVCYLIGWEIRKNNIKMLKCLCVVVCFFIGWKVKEVNVKILRSY